MFCIRIWLPLFLNFFLSSMCANCHVRTPSTNQNYVYFTLAGFFPSFFHTFCFSKKFICTNDTTHSDVLLLLYSFLARVQIIHLFFITCIVFRSVINVFAFFDLFFFSSIIIALLFRRCSFVAFTVLLFLFAFINSYKMQQ